MAVLKKNQVNQILFTMVDRTDYVTLETSLASNFTIKRVGVNHGSAAANISTLSRAPSKVGSGLYRLSLEANATNYDYVALRIAHASALTQILVYEMRTYDDTDTYSQLSDVGSNVLSYLAGMSNTLSAVYVDTADISNILSNTHADLADLSSITSNIYSLLSSRVTKEVASKSLLSDVNSNLLSYLGGMSNILSAVYVDTADISNVLSNVHADLADLSGIVSDFYSDFGSRVPKEVVSKSLMSDYHSDLKSAIGNVSVTLGVSDISDIASAVAAGITTLGPSDISDIASAVWAYGTKEVSLGASDLSDIRSVVLSLSGMLSDAHSAAAQANSRVLVAQSSISDIYSLMSDFNSNFDSRVPKEVASKSLLSDVNSNLLSYLGGISDTLSAVYVDTAGISDILSNVHGDLADLSSIGSNIYSLLSDLNSNLDSRIPKEVANASQLLLMKSNLSDIESAIDAQDVVLASQFSDILSGVTEARKILRNKMVITSATGAAKLYDDDDSIMLSNTITADATSTVRTRLG
jgi:hypothetical protein